MKGTIEALITTAARITALYLYLMPSLSSLSPFTEGKGASSPRSPSEPAGQAPCPQAQCALAHRPLAFCSLLIFSH